MTGHYSGQAYVEIFMHVQEAYTVQSVHARILYVDVVDTTPITIQRGSRVCMLWLLFQKGICAAIPF